MPSMLGENMKKGIWVTDSCPLCMRKIIPNAIFEQFKKILIEEGLEKALKLLYKIPELAKFDILMIRGKVGSESFEMPIAYPLCRNCSRFARIDKFREKIVNNLTQNKQMLQLIEGFDVKEWLSKPRDGRCIF
ncbi:MAG: hypothetical protein QXV06_05420 [Ignisphaera sp.]